VDSPLRPRLSRPAHPSYPVRVGFQAHMSIISLHPNGFWLFKKSPVALVAALGFLGSLHFNANYSTYYF
jgi:hypothetical protein